MSQIDYRLHLNSLSLSLSRFSVSGKELRMVEVRQCSECMSYHYHTHNTFVYLSWEEEALKTPHPYPTLRAFGTDQSLSLKCPAIIS